jgi:hypothetical protein
MDISRSLSEFIIEEFVPAATQPANKFALGMLAGAGGIFGFSGMGEATDALSVEQIESLIRAGFAAQPTLTVRIADFLAEDAIKKYPLLGLPIIKNVLYTPYDIDLEAAEKLITKLKQY